jgi:hypothetical protein
VTALLGQLDGSLVAALRALKKTGERGDELLRFVQGAAD